MLNTYIVTPQVFAWIDVALRRKQAQLVQLGRTVDSDSRLHVCMMGRPAASGDRRLIVSHHGVGAVGAVGPGDPLGVVHLRRRREEDDGRALPPARGAPRLLEVSRCSRGSVSRPPPPPRPGQVVVGQSTGRRQSFARAVLDAQSTMHPIAGLHFSRRSFQCQLGGLSSCLDRHLLVACMGHQSVGQLFSRC